MLTTGDMIRAEGNYREFLSDVALRPFMASAEIEMRRLLSDYANIKTVLGLDAVTSLGLWDASANSPALVDGTGNTGDYYTVSAEGIQDLGSGAIDFAVDEVVIYDGSIWLKLSVSHVAPDVKAVECQKAETLLALAYSIIPLHNRATEQGGFVVSVGLQSGETRLKSFGEAKRLELHFKEQALKLLSPFLGEDIDTSGDVTHFYSPSISFYAV